MKITPRVPKFKGMRSLFCCWYPRYEKFEGMRSLFCCWYPRCGKFMGMISLFCCWYPCCEKVWGYEKLVLLLIPTLWKVWGYEKLVLLQIPKLWKPEGITRERYIPKYLLWAFCVLGLCRKNVLWDTKFAANNVQKGEYGSIGKKLALRYSFWDKVHIMV